MYVLYRTTYLTVISESNSLLPTKKPSRLTHITETPIMIRSNKKRDDEKGRTSCLAQLNSLLKCQY